MKKKHVMEITDESSVTFQSSVSGLGEFGLSNTQLLLIEGSTCQFESVLL